MIELLSSPEAWISLVTLTAMEIVLGIDNIVFLSILAGRLPQAEQPRARRLGLAFALLTRLALPAALAEEVARLIRLTQHHEVASGDHNGMVLMDADLAILGARPKRYDRYAAAIRAEYAHVDDDTYRAGRAAVLEGFLAKGSIYHCYVMVNRCDAPARANMTRELTALRG